MPDIYLPWTANGTQPLYDQNYMSGDRPEGGGGTLIHSDDFSNYQPGVNQDGFTWVFHPSVNQAPDPDDALNDTAEFYMQGTPSSTAGAELGFELDSAYSELWVKYRLYIPANYVHRDRIGETDNNKGE